MAEAEERKEAEIHLVTENEVKPLKPWEQHASVITIPRFDYNAPSALRHHSHSGFLITCSIKREKSATKEVMLILDKYIRPYDSDSTKIVHNSSTNTSIKRRKLNVDEIGQTSIAPIPDVEIKNIVENAGVSKDEVSSHKKKSTAIEGSFVLSLVKLIRSGLLLLIFVSENPPNTVDIVSDIFQCLESEGLKSPIWCHRIFPIQATCHLNEKELRPVVSNLVHNFMTVNKSKLTLPIKFAVGYNKRGIETEVKVVKDAPNNSNLLLLDRNKCFNVVASAIKDAVSDSVVDLKSPDLSVLVELLPLSTVPSGSFIAAVSVLPQNLVSTKPRLCIRPLISDAKVRTGKN